jgi:hypothetical protein
MDNNKEGKKTTRAKTSRRARLPKEPFKNIALSLSGGGFRATAFHLGVLAYLSSIKLNGISLLERTRILSTVSAGTFAGVKYVATIKKGGDVKDFYRDLYHFLTKENLVDEALKYLSHDKNWSGEGQRGLINAFAAMYHKEFESEYFGLLWNEHPQIHLKEISFNATEFNFARPFHFRKTERSKSKTSANAHEFIGNKKIHIPVSVAKEIRLSDITAASSCFPFGFEPINFPDDFIHEESDKLRDKSLLPRNVYDGDKIEYPIGLMDGGIDDNQGVDAILWAEERMKNYPDDLKEFGSDDKKAVDLYILSDGSNPNMESYMRSNSDKLRFGRKWNFNKLRAFGIVCALLGVTSFFFASYNLSKPLIIFLAAAGTLGLLTAFVLLIFSMGFVGLTRLLGVPEFFVDRLRHVDKLRFGLLNNLFVNRRNSAMKLLSKVFIKQMRWFSHERVYGDPSWKPRVIMNSLYDLTEEEVIKRKQKYLFLSKELSNPEPDIMWVAAKAGRKGTTLWFTPEELQGNKNMLDSITACGSYTICFNLLEYYEKFLYHPTYKKNYEKYSPEMKESLKELHDTLLADWAKFQKNPYWMVREWNENAQKTPE